MARIEGLTMGADGSVPESPFAKAPAVYDAAADCFDAPALAFWDRFGRSTVARLGLRPSDRVLDVCCGSGASAIPAAEAVGTTGKVVGVDLAERLLELARAKAARGNLRQVEFRLGDLTSPGLPAESFDAVVCVFGIFFAQDMAAALAGLWQLVKPSGVLAITNWGKRAFELGSTSFWNAVHRVRPDLERRTVPWERVSTAAGVSALFTEARVPGAQVEVATSTHPLRTVEDWWDIVMGSGLRGIVEQLSHTEREQVREINLRDLEQAGVTEIGASVVYGMARKHGNQVTT